MKSVATLFFVMNLFFLYEARAQWEQTGGPQGGYPMSFVSMGGTVYAGSFAGAVFRSSDNGDSWSWAGNGLPVGAQTKSFAIDGAALFAATSSGVYKTADGGDSWTASQTGLPAGSILSLFAFGSSLFAGTSGSGVYMSTDHGASWTIDTAGLTPSGLSVRCFASIGTDLFAGTQGGVYRTQNGGATWSAASSGLTDTDVNAVAVAGGALLAGTQLHGVFRSTDNGTSWGGGQNSITFALAVIGSDAFAAGTAGVQRSTDGGVTWKSSNTGIPPTNNCRSLGVQGTTLFVGMGNNGDRGGIYRSADQAGTWTEANTGYVNTQVYVLRKYTNGLLAGCADGSLSRSTDDGTNWSPVKNFGAGVTSLYAGGTYWYLGTGASVGGVHRSSDEGATWQYAGTGLPVSGTIQGLVGIGGYVIAGSSSGGIYRTLDNANWTVSNTGLTNTSVNALITFGIYTYAGTSGGFFISSNSGQSWSISNTGLTILNIRALASPAPSVVYAGSYGGGVSVSTDNGANWSPASSGLSGLGLYVTSLAVQGTSVIAGTLAGVFASYDQGANWTEVNTGLKNTLVQSLNLDVRSFLTAGTLGNGAWRRPVSEVLAVRAAAAGAPARFRLDQNFPNPFNPSTEIRFSVEESGPVALKVYDVLGREVAVLVNGQLHRGAYSASWDASGVPSGLYTYRLTAGAHSQTKMMVVVK